jgi:hypothetical protein
VSDEEAIETSGMLSRAEGIFAGYLTRANPVAPYEFSTGVPP